MEYRELGSSGIKASAVALGCFTFGGLHWGGADDRESLAAIACAVDAGITLIDTAPIYGCGRSEELVGRALKGRRDKVVLATKCGLNWHEERGEYFFTTDSEPAGRKVYRNLAPDAVAREVDDCLRRLQTHYIDLYQTHWQTETTPIEDTMAALLTAKDAGKIRAIGVSNATPAEMDRYHAQGAIVSCQSRYHMLARDLERDVIPYCRDRGMAFLAYSPLGQGLLTGKIRPGRSFNQGDIRLRNAWIRDPSALAALCGTLDRVFQPIADGHSATLGQTVIAWTLAQPGVTHALCGARRPDQVEENVRGGEVRLSEDEITAMREAVERLPTPNAQ